MVQAYDPEVVVMGGGIMKSHEVIIPYIQEAINTRSWTPWGKVKLMTCTHSDSSVLLGAGYLLSQSVV